MLKSYAARYGFIALGLSVAYMMLYVVLESGEIRQSEARVVSLWNRPEGWLVILIPCTLIVLALSAGWQRDQLGQETRRRGVLNAMLRTLIASPRGGSEPALQEALTQLTNVLDTQAAAILLRERQAWKAISPDPAEAGLAIARAQTWPPAPQQVVTLAAMQAEGKWGALPASWRWIWLIPIDVENQAAGWLLVASHQKRPLPPAAAEWLLMVADQIGAALTRARQETLLRRRARDWEAITQINRTLLAGMELDDLLATIVGSAQVRFGLSYVTVLWIDEAMGEFYIRAQAGMLPAIAAPGSRQKITNSIATRVRQTGQSCLVTDTRQEPGYNPVAPAEILSVFMAPLNMANTVIGVMTFESLSVEAFSVEDVAALTMLADQAAIAAENARLLMAAQREQQRLAAILRSSPDVVLLVDAAECVQLLNPAAERLLQRAASQIIGRRLEDLLDSFPLLLALAPGQPAEQTLEVPWNDRVTYLATVSPAQDEQGQEFGRVVVMHDITYLKQLDQLKSQMVQMLSHDIRAPLGVAAGYLDVLKEDLQPATPFREKVLRGLEIALERMQHLATELLDLERVEAGVDRMREPIDVAQLAREAVEEFGETAQAKRQHLELTVPDRLPTLTGDPLRLKQALSNLISNAVKYTPEDGHIGVRVTQDDQQVFIKVEDTGFGIPLKAQPQMFQRFFRAKAPGTENVPGTGLGLSLVKAIIEQHGGKISFTSEPGRGTTFTVQLPVA